MGSQGDRLRSRQVDDRERDGAGSDARRICRHAYLRQPGAARERSSRCSLGYLLVRRDPLGRAHRGLPCPGKTIAEIRPAQTELALPLEQLRARRIPAAVVTLLRATLAVNPALRPASPRQLLVALESCRAQLFEPNESGWRRIGRPAMVAGALALIGAAGFFAFQKLKPAAASPATTREQSIAVLPFENLSNDPGNEYFAEGIQDNILTSLAKSAN